MGEKLVFVLIFFAHDRYDNFIYPFITVAHNLIQITLRIKYRVNLLVINTFPLPNSLSPYDSSSTQSYLTVDNLTSYPYYKLYPICLRPQRFQLREDSKVHIRYQVKGIIIRTKRNKETNHILVA